MIDPLASKLRRPLARPGSVSRLALIVRLAGYARPVVSTTAPVVLVLDDVHLLLESVCRPLCDAVLERSGVH